MAVRAGGGEISRKILLALELILGQDIEESDKIEEAVDEEEPD